MLCWTAGMENNTFLHSLPSLPAPIVYTAATEKIPTCARVSWQMLTEDEEAFSNIALLVLKKNGI